LRVQSVEFIGGELGGDADVLGTLVEGAGPIPGGFQGEPNCCEPAVKTACELLYPCSKRFLASAAKSMSWLHNLFFNLDKYADPEYKRAFRGKSRE
jgi:hypothetical protein